MKRQESLDEKRFATVEVTGGGGRWGRALPQSRSNR